ncbi:MAG: hypothetical protein ABEK03_09360 [Candidatus Bipolaricaulia bacterium]
MSTKRFIHGIALLLAVGGLGFVSFSLAAPVKARPTSPQVLQTIVPDRITGARTAYGTVQFVDPQADVTKAEFHVIDGKFNPFEVSYSPNRRQLSRGTDGDATTVAFPLDCSMADQRVTLKLELVDRQGNRSRPTPISFTCGSPLRGNFDEEQAQTRPVNHRVTMNLFVLDEGVNSLSDGAGFPSADAAIGQPRERLQAAVREQIVPAITRIWDQCGVGFRLGTFKIVRPGQIALSQGSLAEELFVQRDHLPEIALANDPLRVMSEAHDRIDELLEPQKSTLGANELTVFASSARLVAQPDDEQQFGGLTTVMGRVSFVRWDAVLPETNSPGPIMLPKRVVTAMAHEFGHNFGLGHVSEPSDRRNLMFADPDGRAVHVPPQPPVALKASQCDKTIDHIRNSGLGQADEQSPDGGP